MMLVPVVWFSDSKKAKLTSIIFSIITLICLVLLLTSWLIHNYKINNYERVTGTITTNDLTDPDRTGTEISYTYQGKEYTSIISKNSYLVGWKVDLLCNPKEPTVVSLYNSTSVTIILSLIGVGVFGFFTLMYFINYKIVQKNKAAI